MAEFPGAKKGSSNQCISKQALHLSEKSGVSSKYKQKKITNKLPYEMAAQYTIRSEQT